MSKNMSGQTIATGVILTVMGVGFYLLAGQEAGPGKPPSVTALIPAFIGVPILALGLAARDSARRKMTMHIAATLGLLGALGSLMGAKKWPLILTGQSVTRPLAAWEQLLMFLVCVVFVIGCVQSFRAARRAPA